MSWRNRQFKVPVQDEGYPFIQFVHDGAALEPRRKTGGFAMPADQAQIAGGAPAGAEYAALHFKSGESTDVFFSDRLTVAPLTYRFAWIKDGVRIQYTEGARGKLQLLAFVRSDEGWVGPVMLTATGLASKDLMAALKAHRARVRRATAGKAPCSVFAMTIQAGQARMEGKRQQSRVTPIVLADEFDPDRDYVGDELADRIEREWGEYERWSRAWSSPGPNGEGEIEEDETGEDAGPAPQTPAGAPTTETVVSDREESDWPWDVPLPFPSKKYGTATVGTLYNARDYDALKALIRWCEERGGYDHVVRAARTALQWLDEEMPF